MNTVHEKADEVIVVANLAISFGNTPPAVVVENLNFSIAPGETLAVVGESGSGKSITSLSLMGLLPADASASGAAFFTSGPTEQQLLRLSEKEWQNVRGQSISMVFSGTHECP